MSKQDNFFQLLFQKKQIILGELISMPFELCFRLAIKGMGKVSPNPLVGAVVLDKDNALLGYGYHEQYGSHHAEVHAIQMAKTQKPDLSECKIYVNLQPCTHKGKTPACAELIKKEKLKEVCYLLDDPNPLVGDNGSFSKANNNEEVARYQDLIAPFLFTCTNKNRPFIAVKTAVSKDGYIAEQGDSRRWVTNEECRNYGHLLRHYYDAVLVGRKTVELDKPNLLPRLNFMDEKIPWRIILDKDLKTLADQKTLLKNIRKKTILVHSSQTSEDFDGLTSMYVESQNYHLQYILKSLRKDYLIQSILVEGGASTHASFFDEGVVDRVYKFSGDKNMKSPSAIAWYQSKNPFQFDLCKELELSGHRLQEYVRPDLLPKI